MSYSSPSRTKTTMPARTPLTNAQIREYDEAREWHPSYPESIWGAMLDTAIYYRDRLKEANRELLELQNERFERKLTSAARRTRPHEEKS